MFKEKNFGAPAATLDPNKMPTESRPLSERDGKTLERIVLGQMPYGDSLSVLEKRNDNFRMGLVDTLSKWTEKDFVPLEESRAIDGFPLYDKESVIELIENNYNNPYSLKKATSDLDEQLKSINKEINRVRENDKQGIKISENFNLDFLYKKRDLIKKSVKLWGNIKGTSSNFFQLRKIGDEMAKMQEAEPVTNLFSINLISSIKSSLERKKIQINKIQYVTTLVEGDNYITWPDYFGSDAFVDYEIVIEGKIKKGRIYMDGTKNPEKVPNDVHVGAGTMNSKLMIPFTKLEGKPSLQSLGSETGQYIVSKCLL